MGGLDLLKYKYRGSIYDLLSKVYPNYDWLPWKFADRLHNFWDIEKNQTKFMEWATQKLNINKMSDWYQITQNVYNV
jgi:hypothetical protein